MTYPFGIEKKKINLQPNLFRPKLVKMVISKKYKMKLEEKLIFGNTSLLALSEYFAFKEMYGQKGLLQ